MTTASQQPATPAEAQSGGGVVLQRLVLPASPKPYYDEDGITIYHGDNRQIVPLLPRFDLLLTDPPYGIGIGSDERKNLGGPNLAIRKDYGQFEWDTKTVEAWVIEMLRSRTDRQIIFGGNYYALPASTCWLVWG